MISDQSNYNNDALIKSSRYTGCDFMFFYRFVRRYRRRRLIHVYSITFEKLFGFLYFGTIIGPDLSITWLDIGGFSSWPWPWIFKVKYAIC